MTDQTDADVILAELRPSQGRRGVGVLCLGLLGGGLIWLVLANPPDLLALTLLVLTAGAVALWLAVRLWQATASRLILTATSLMDDQGQVLVHVADIKAVNVGVFAFKPAGGFTLSLRSSAPRAWAPGLWWRLGTRLGVGGVVNRFQARYMAEALSHLLTKRP